MAFYHQVPDKKKKKTDYGEKGPWEEEGSSYMKQKNGNKKETDKRYDSGIKKHGKFYASTKNSDSDTKSRSTKFQRKKDVNSSDFSAGKKSYSKTEKAVPIKSLHKDTLRIKPAQKSFSDKPESFRYQKYEFTMNQTVSREDTDMMNHILCGRNPIREALKSGRDMEKILIQRGELSGSAREIVQTAKSMGVMIQETDKTRLDEIAPHHQGIIAFTSAYSYSSVDEILKTAEERNEEPFLILLDGITDPHNLGAIIRTAECAGAHGVIVPQHRSVGLTPAAVKASAGAVEYVKVARVNSLNKVIDDLKQKGIWIYAVTMNGTDFRKMDFRGPTALIIGAEGDGISRLTGEKCDMSVSLPINGHIDSLNASVAAGIMMYAVLSSRQK